MTDIRRTLDLLPTFEPELAKASTLPARAYRDEDLHALELDRIFARTWQPVAALEDLQKPGDFVTSEVAGEPVVVARDLGGHLVAYYNVCRHRAGPVAEGKGNRRSFMCRYHGWTYGLDGRLVATPEFDGVQNFDKACFGLVPVAVDTFGPFVFVHLDKDPPSLASVLGHIPAASAPHRLDAMRRTDVREYVVECNWKTYVDNYLEGYHVPVVHPSLHRELDYDAYVVETHRFYSAQHAPIRKGNPSAKVERQYADATDAQALYFWVFPNWMINIYPDNMSINIVLPMGPHRTRTVFEWYFHDPDAPGAAAARERSVAFSDLIQQEDIHVCEAVHKRLGSRAYDRGRFSVKRENGVHHFQGLVTEFLRADAAPRV